MADYVKGYAGNDYSQAVLIGIRMHRRIDVLTDTHPLVKQARQLFPNEYRRVAPITLDIFWDHFLSLHWDKFEPTYRSWNLLLMCAIPLNRIYGELRKNFKSSMNIYGPKRG